MYNWSLCPALPVVNDPDSHSVTLTEGDDLELVCTGWAWPVPDQYRYRSGTGILLQYWRCAWPVPHVVWTRDDGSGHVYAAGDPGVSLRHIRA